jgi:PPK2 family polyphosphate:nucleotide phosphotransferase
MKKTFRLNDISTLPPAGFLKKHAAVEAKILMDKLIEIQNKLYAQNKYSVLIILQGMDTSGKDSAIKHVFSGINPSGCRVKSFKVPSEEENAHHFLWRISKECPEKRFIQIFNRSHYEHILENAVNNKMKKADIKLHFTEVNVFEKGLELNNTIILKFYLHVSHKVQLERLESRKESVHKRWKYQEEDVKSIGKHEAYRKIYESIFENTQIVPWEIIPSDKKWYKNHLILKKVVETLEKYKIEYPKKSANPNE